MASQPPTGPYGDDHAQWQAQDTLQSNHYQPYSDASPPPPPVHRNHPAAHPSSSFNTMQTQRRRSMQTLPPQEPPSPTRNSPPRAINTQRWSISRKPLSPPPQQEPIELQQQQSQRSPSPVSPYHSTRPSRELSHEQRPSEAQRSGHVTAPAAAVVPLAGAAYGGSQPQDGGMQALRDIDNLYGPGHMGQADPVSRDATPYADAYETPHQEQGRQLHQPPPPPPQHQQQQRQPYQSYNSSSSVVPLAGAAYAPGQTTPHSFQSTTSLRTQDGPLGLPPSARQLNSYNSPSRGHLPMPTTAATVSSPLAHSQTPPQRQSWYENYNPYDSHSISRPPVGFNDIDPNSIADDDDDGLEYVPQQAKRRSMLGLGRYGDSRSSLPPSAAAAGGAAAGAAAVAAGMPHSHGPGFFGANPGSRDASGTYTPVPGGSGAGTTGPPSSLEFGAEKAHDSDWLASQTSGRKRMRWIVGSIIAVLVVLIVVGAVVGGVLGSRGSSNSASAGGESAAEDDGSGLLSLHSSEIQALMNNKDLHRVFPGIDYTPINTQYPDCLTNPPSQNNVTRDMAVLSQLTNTLRLYGNDCNQTEMALEAISRLQLTDMKLWLGVWLGNNDTTNSRQVSTAWDILDKHGADPFVGVAVGNEVLFRQDLTSAQLATYLSDFRDDLKTKKLDLPVATSDLGSNWTPELAAEVDIVMANVHPFFAGVQVDVAAEWTWSFWQSNDVAVSDTASGQKNIISEVGWPSGGGNDCGTTPSGPNACATDSSGSVAGIDEMNQFMGDWVCQALSNGTDYFWFEAFDEPWKIKFNKPSLGQQWEDKWGLMDVNRNLKSGVKIPDCAGQTVSRR